VFVRVVPQPDEPLRSNIGKGAVHAKSFPCAPYFPILPRLVEDVTHAQNVAPYIGILTALYAAMQFAFAPVLGALGDRLGRRPVLLVSLGGAAVNYGLMAVAPSLWLLIAGRAIAGLTSANISVATAYMLKEPP